MNQIRRETSQAMIEELMRFLAAQGEMSAQEFLKKVPRIRGDYLDFYPIAALLHANYINTDSTVESAGKVVDGQLGVTMKKTAVFLCQLMLPVGESFYIDGCARESACNFPLNVFITSEGYFRLEELEQRNIERVRQREAYIISLGIGVFLAILSSFLAHYFASQRVNNEYTKHMIVECKSPIIPNSSSLVAPHSNAASSVAFPR